MSLRRLENDSLAIFNALDDDLGQRHISELKFALVLLLLQADIKDIN
jgi:hypothetical protein